MKEENLKRLIRAQAPSIPSLLEFLNEYIRNEEYCYLCNAWYKLYYFSHHIYFKEAYPEIEKLRTSKSSDTIWWEGLGELGNNKQAVREIRINVLKNYLGI